MSGPLEFVLQLSDRELRLTAGQTITAGRIPQCELQLDDPAVSRRHCTIACTDEGLRVRDLEPANGTFVNDRPVKEASVHAGDRLRLGATLIDVRDPSSRASGTKTGTVMLNDAAGDRISDRAPHRAVEPRVAVDIESRERRPARAAPARAASPLRAAPLSALLHDVGNIAVPDAILNKPDRLTPEEIAEMQKHTLHGARILGNIETAAVKAVLPGVQYHHERWDGSGYPEGLKAEEIPFLGRLLAGAALRLFERGELLADAPSSVIVRLEE